MPQFTNVYCHAGSHKSGTASLQFWARSAMKVTAVDGKSAGQVHNEEIVSRTRSGAMPMSSEAKPRRAKQPAGNTSSEAPSEITYGIRCATPKISTIKALNIVIEARNHIRNSVCDTKNQHHQGLPEARKYGVRTQG